MNVGFKPDGTCDVIFSATEAEITVEHLQDDETTITDVFSFLDTYLHIQVRPLVEGDPNNLRKILSIQEVAEPLENFLRFSMRNTGGHRNEIVIEREKRTDWSWALRYIGTEDTKVERTTPVSTCTFNLENGTGYDVILHSSRVGDHQDIFIFHSRNS